jgi:ankyrin repeat protein
VKPWPATLVELASERTEELSLKDFKELLSSSSKQETPFSKGALVRVCLRDTWMNASIQGKKEKPDRKSFKDETAADKWSRECHEFIDKRRKGAEEAKLKEAEAKAKAEQLAAAEQVAPPNELLKARKASEAATEAADEASKKATKAAEKAKPAIAADDYYFDGEKYSGVMYEVMGRLEDGEVEEKVKEMHEEDVIALCHSGLPLVLCVAAHEGEPRVVDALLEAKVSPYATDKNGSTALIRICSRRENLKKEHYECIELLLNATCKQFFHVRNLQRQNAYDLATHNKQCETLRLMSPSSYPCMLLGTKEDREKDERKFKKRDYWAHDETWASGMSTLMVTLRFAPKETVEDCVRKLLARRADESEDERLTRLKPLVNIPHPKGGSTALHMALVSEDLPEVVELLLMAGADVNAKEEAEDNSSIVKDGRTPLLQAAQAGHVEATKRLIKYKADPFFTRDTRSTLMYADFH